jgi:hypothetical protein
MSHLKLCAPFLAVLTAKSTLGKSTDDACNHKECSQSVGVKGSNMIRTRPYPSARVNLVRFLESSGFKPHPLEVFCPSSNHCWVDVAATKGPDLWAFEYKSRSDSIRRGLEQCQSYSCAFNYVVLVADRRRVTASPYFSKLKREGFGVWRHSGTAFYSILTPRRQPVAPMARRVVERQFRRLLPRAEANRSILDWM